MLCSNNLLMFLIITAFAVEVKAAGAEGGGGAGGGKKRREGGGEEDAREMRGVACFVVFSLYAHKICRKKVEGPPTVLKSGGDCCVVVFLGMMTYLGYYDAFSPSGDR